MKILLFIVLPLVGLMMLIWQVLRPLPKCPICGSQKNLPSHVPLDVECCDCGHRFTPCLARFGASWRGW